MTTGRVHPLHLSMERATPRRERIRTWVPALAERQPDDPRRSAPDPGREGNVVRGED
ncbi:hypothetical protein [Streptomyces albipurpureus]|uniref:Uncharacterized protein n=1 Tax=Streptomyces albipurpureus TaxID=2897419 RepID=A0ABT0UQF3_9ACTN|nr:hypothetical protein [Streptomyces sp. CWNU-1]MCM2390689.1 hypothetical protein [Streptomyces sp. CWNU-1]